MLIFLCLLIAAASAQPSYVVSDGTNLIMVGSCGQPNATSISGANLYSEAGTVYFQSGMDLMTLTSAGQTATVCTGCIPATPWIVHESNIIGWSSGSITSTPTSTGISSVVYTAQNAVRAVAVVEDIVYWIEDTPGDNDNLWAATYPSFGTPTKNNNGLLIYPYSAMVVQDEYVLMYGEGNADSFRARDDPTLSVRDRSFASIPDGSALAGASPADDGWVYVTRAGGMAERFSGQCLKNITTSLPSPLQSVASFTAVQCPTATCWQASPQTSGAGTLPTGSIFLPALFGLILMFA